MAESPDPQALAKVQEEPTPPRPDEPAPAQPATAAATIAPPNALDPASVQPVVQRMLATFLGTIQVDGEGTMTFAYESTRVFVEVRPWEDASVVSVWAPVAYEVPNGPTLYEWIAKQSDRWAFGHVGLAEFPTTATVMFRRTFPAEFLTEEHLRHTVGIVATTADGLDDEIVHTLGGKRAKDAEGTSAAAGETSGGAPAGDDDLDQEAPGYL